MRKLSLIGNLGRDAKVFETTGVAALQFTVATQERHKDSTGVWGEITAWHNITYWGKLDHLKNLMPHLTKGTKVYLEGTFSLSVYKEQPQIDVACNALTICSSKT